MESVFADTTIMIARLPAITQLVALARLYPVIEITIDVDFEYLDPRARYIRYTLDTGEYTIKYNTDVSIQIYTYEATAWQLAAVYVSEVLARSQGLLRESVKRVKI